MKPTMKRPIDSKTLSAHVCRTVHTQTGLWKNYIVKQFHWTVWTHVEFANPGHTVAQYRFVVVSIRI